MTEIPQSLHTLLPGCQEVSISCFDMTSQADKLEKLMVGN